MEGSLDIFLNQRTPKGPRDVLSIALVGILRGARRYASCNREQMRRFHCAD
jgi:hypothetical protein